MKWFRWYRDTCEDGKFRIVARMSRVTIRDVLAVWAFILEDASRMEHRGVCVRNETDICAILDFDDNGTVERILEAMESANLVSVGHGAITVSNWNTRQYESDLDSSAAERQRRKRDRDKSRTSNAPVTRDSPTQTTDTDTEEEKKKDGANAPADPSIPEREYFVRGREVLGKGAGGLIGKLLKSKGGNVSLARAAIEQSSQKQNPTEYVAAICRGPPVIKPNTAHQQERQTGREILDDIGKFISSNSSEADTGLLRYNPSDGPESIRGRIGGDLVELSAASARTRG